MPMSGLGWTFDTVQIPTKNCDPDMLMNCIRLSLTMHQSIIQAVLLKSE